MSFTLTCEKGDSMPKIAAENGFADYNTIWQRPDNEALRKQRPNPNVLCAGDQVFVPDKTPKSVAAATGAEHKFTLKGKATRLRLLVLDFAGSPCKSSRFQLTVDGQSAAVTTDAQGLLDQPIPPLSATATLAGDAIGELHLQIGALDPAAEKTGLLERLYNLGYTTGPDELDVDDDALAFAIALFCADNKLPIDNSGDGAGADSAALQAKLEDVHGS